MTMAINGTNMIISHRVQCLILMNAQEAQTLQLHEMVVWTPDGMKGEVIVKDGLASKSAGKTASSVTINLPT